MSRLEERLARLSPEQRRLLELKLRREGFEIPISSAIPKAPAAEDYPLTFGQQRLWFIDRLMPGTPAYNIPFAGRLRGAVALGALERALNGVIQRHQVLRSRFEARDGKAIQQVQESLEVPLRLVDLCALPEARRGEEEERLSAAEARFPFDLTRVPLIRVTLLRREPELHFLQVTMPHLVTDAWSMGVFFRELPALYNSDLEGRPSPLAELPIQVADYAVWQRRRLDEGLRAKELEFWRQQLADAPTVLELPTDRPRPPRQSFQGERYAVPMPEGLVRRLGDFHRRQEVTPFMTYLAVWGTLLQRFSGQRDLLVGSPVATREAPETQGLIGFFINTAVLRVDLRGRPTFRQALQRIKAMALATFAHQELPFEALVEEFWHQRGLSRTPLTQVTFVLQNVHITRPDFRDLELTHFQQTGTGTARDDLMLGLWEGDDGGLAGWFEYSTDLFDRTTVLRLSEQLLRLFDGALEDPDRPLSRLPLLGPAQRTQLLEEWGRRPLPKAAGQKHEEASQALTIHGRFALACRRHPQAVALEAEDHRLTYQQVAERAADLAQRLLAAGARPDQVIPLLVAPGPDLVIAQLAVLQAGAAYLPLDAEDPAHRLASLLAAVSQGSPPLLVTEASSAAEDALNRLRQEKSWQVEPRLLPLAGEPAPEELPLPKIGSGHLAYVAFTSGSTGRPKGVAVPHGAVLRLLDGLDTVDLTPADTVLQLAPPTFDAATFEVWAPLLSGARLAFPASRKPTLPELAAELERFEVSVLWLTAGLFHLLVDEKPDALAAVKTVLAGGDVLSPDHVRRLLERKPEGQVINGYGPTEGTTFTTCRPFSRPQEVGATVSLGRPLGGTGVLVLGPELELQPPGVPGELGIAGGGLARGYLGQAAETARCFVPHPYGGAGERLYRSGDRVRWRPDGELEFLGRLDEQVKIRGFRVEPREVEQALASHPGVRQAVVVARRSDSQPPKIRLAAYYLPADDEAPAPEELRRFLRSRLPEAFLPAHLIPLQAWPLNANGKVDRRALPLPETEEALSTGPQEAPQGPAAEILAKIWSELLGVEEVGAHDDFFQLGGDSILSIQALSRAAEAGVHLSVQDLFLHPTLAELAPLARTEGLERPVAEAGPVPLTSLQRWFFDRHPPQPDHWNLAFWLRPRMPLDLERLKRAAAHLPRRHDALRLRFEHRQGRWRQVLTEDLSPPPVQYQNRQDSASEELGAALEALATAEQQSLSLADGPLLRLALVQLEGEEQRLLVVIHHLAADTVSCGLLTADLERLYQAQESPLAESSHPESPGPEGPTLENSAWPFSAWARDSARRLPPEELAALAEAWELAPFPPLPVDHGAASDVEGDAASVASEISAQLTDDLLHRAPLPYNNRVDEILLAALVEAAAPWTGVRRLALSLESHGRTEPGGSADLSATIGWFTALFPVDLDLRAVAPLGESLKAVKEAVRSVGRRPLGERGPLLLRALGHGSDSRSGLEAEPQLSFNYLGRVDAQLGSGELLELVDLPLGPLRGPANPRSHALEITALVQAGRLRLIWTYGRKRHRPETVEALSRRFEERLQELVDHCRDPQAGGYTPADFQQVEVSQEELDRILLRVGSERREE